jgi:transcriptional regulator
MKPKTLTDPQIYALLDSRCKQQGQATVARALGTTPQKICDIRRGRRTITPGVIAGLGYRKTVRYEPIA